MTYPTDPEFAAVNVDSQHANIRSETRSGRTQVRSIGSQRWSFTAKYNQLTREQFAPVYAFILSTGSGVSSFEIVPPVISSTSGSASGSVRANGSRAVGHTDIPIDGLTGTLKAGDFIKFESHSKVYMVTSDITGAGTLSFTPALIAAVTDNQLITYNNVPFTMRIANNVQRFSLSGFDRYEYEVDMIEVI